jgi:ABC-type multidrug transport system fused ATPase/permease subunit
MMLGMYFAFYIFTGFGIQAAFGSVVGPYVTILIATPALFAIGYVVHKLLITRVTGIRTASLEGEGHYQQLVLTLGIALILQNGGMILFGSQLVSAQTPLSSTAWGLGPKWGDFVSVFVNKPMLQLEGVHAGYSAVPLLHGILIAVGAEQFVSILGPNGAGKTTLFKTISGTVRPTGGSIRFEDVDLLAVPPARRPHLGIAYVPEGGARSSHR